MATPMPIVTSEPIGREAVTVEFSSPTLSTTNVELAYTDEELALACAAATEAPWVQEFESACDELCPQGSHVATARWAPVNLDASTWFEASTAADAALIVMARNALPGLLARIADLEAEVRALREAQRLDQR